MREYSDTAKIRLYRRAVEGGGGCVLFGGYVAPDGYGRFGPGGQQRMTSAHIAAWELVNGPVPSGLHLDHTCHDPATCKEGKQCPHRRCINPEHIQPVTRAHNLSAARARVNHWAERTHCIHGHEFNDENTYITKRGSRACRACRRGWAAERRKRPEVRERNNTWRRGNEKVLARRRELRRLRKEGGA